MVVKLIGNLKYGLIRNTNFKRFLNVEYAKKIVNTKFEDNEFPSATLSKLDNGVRICTFKTDSPTCTVGLFINAGSRYETEETNGSAHFLEHMAFKGSSLLSQDMMEREVEQIGAKLFAYTSREHTAYHAKCFATDGPRIVEILSDIVQRPTLNDSAIQREKGVILREMEEVEKEVEEVIFDYLHGTAYQGSPLGYTILGPSQNIKNMTKKNLADYIDLHYTGPRTVLVAVGDVEHNEYVDLAKKHLGNLSSSFFSKGADFDLKPAHYVGSEVKIRIDDMPHANIAIAFEGVSHTDPNFIPLMIASTYIGSYNQSMALGKTHSSRLAKKAANGDLCNRFSSFNACYNDTGLWGIYFVTERLKIQQMLFAIGREWNYISTHMNDYDAEVAKNLFKSACFLELDGTSAIFEDLGRQILTYNRHHSISELNNLIDAVTTEQIRNALTLMLRKSDPAIASMGPVEALPSYLTTKGFLFNPLK